MAGPMTVRAFARWLGVSHTAVQQRLAAGALPASARRVKGRWRILDAEQAKAEWEAHTRPRVDSRKRTQTGKPSKLADATLRERNARAEAAELENARKKRLVLPVAEFERLWAPRIVGARTYFLGWPTRAKARLPHLTAADLAVLDALVREGLEILAPRAQSQGV